MVSIAVFSIVMVTAMSALINVIDADSKAQAIKTAVDNVNFALDGISRDMRMGKEYSCYKADTNSFSGDCPLGGDGVRFKSSKSGNPYIYYKINGTHLESCVSSGDTHADGCDSTYSALTSAEVDLKSVKFYVIGTGDDTKQPRVVITVSGEAGSKAKTRTNFDLQTSVSQRTRPEKATL